MTNPTSIDSQPVGCALIGLGMVARAHVPALLALPDEVKLCGIRERSEKRLSEFLNTFTFPIPPHEYASVDEIAADPEVDFAIVITPPDARMKLVQTLASAGKHILLEKPIERTTAAAEKIVGICRQSGVSLGVVFQNRMRKSSRDLMRLINSGALGEIGTVEIEVPWWRDQSYYDEPGRGTYARDGGGVLISQAIHTLDLAMTLAGPISAVQAMVTSSKLHSLEAEDFAAAALRFASGAHGFLHATTTSFPGSVERIKLNCEKGSAELKAGELKVFWRNGKIETLTQESGTGGGVDPMAFPFKWHQDIIADFARSIRNGVAPCVSGAAALNVHRVIDAIVDSSDRKQQISLA